MTHFRETWECLLELEVVLVAFVGQLVEFCFVGFEVFDEVYEVTGLFELLKILSIDHVSELVFNSNHKLNRVQGVEAVVHKLAIEIDARLLGCAEVIFYD